MQLIIIFVIALILSALFLGLRRAIGLLIAIAGFTALTSVPIASVVLIPVGLIVFFKR